MMTARRRKHVTPGIVARWLDVNEETVARWIRSGALPALNIGGNGNGSRYRIFRKDLVTFLERRGLITDHVSDLFV